MEKLPLPATASLANAEKLLVAMKGAVERGDTCKSLKVWKGQLYRTESFRPHPWFDENIDSKKWKIIDAKNVYDRLKRIEKAGKLNGSVAGGSADGYPDN